MPDTLTQESINRRRALAQALAQQSYQPIEARETGLPSRRSMSCRLDGASA
jgi:hypothetical protein